ncbi:hypothetical protein BT69DRAFT_204862 [Atractiella rhizophila]|nr:hypothetical protein BT69DRAFT_204862 [Atractiella rhizophila]
MRKNTFTSKFLVTFSGIEYQEFLQQILLTLGQLSVHRIPPQFCIDAASTLPMVYTRNSMKKADAIPLRDKEDFNVLKRTVYQNYTFYFEVEDLTHLKWSGETSKKALFLSKPVFEGTTVRAPLPEHQVLMRAQIPKRHDIPSSMEKQLDLQNKIENRYRCGQCSRDAIDGKSGPFCWTPPNPQYGDKHDHQQFTNKQVVAFARYVASVGDDGLIQKCPPPLPEFRDWMTDEQRGAVDELNDANRHCRLVSSTPANLDRPKKQRGMERSRPKARGSEAIGEEIAKGLLEALNGGYKRARSVDEEQDSPSPTIISLNEVLSAFDTANPNFNPSATLYLPAFEENGVTAVRLADIYAYPDREKDLKEELAEEVQIKKLRLSALARYAAEMVYGEEKKGKRARK